MRNLTFKQFLLSEHLTEQQLVEQQVNEIFGLFKNDEKVRQLIAQRAKLRSAKVGADKALQMEKDKIFKAARDKIMAAQKSYVKPLTPKQLSQIKDKIWADIAAELKANPNAI